jgi:hypothetical protein
MGRRAACTWACRALHRAHAPAAAGQGQPVSSGSWQHQRGADEVLRTLSLALVQEGAGRDAPQRWPCFSRAHDMWRGAWGSTWH